MAISSFLVKAPPRGFVRPQDAIGANPFVTTPDYQGPVYLQFDAMISEAPDYQASATQSQVEGGATISDHVTLKPLKLVVQGIVTDTPVGFKRAFSSVFGASASAAAHQFIKALWKNRIPFDFVGGLDYYTSMVVVSYNPVNTAETGDALKFTCTLEQVVTVNSQVILTAKKVQKKQSLGQQPLGPIKVPAGAVTSAFKGVEPTAATSNGASALSSNPSLITQTMKPLGMIGDPAGIANANNIPALR